MYKKLFIPGPTHVRDEILQAQTVGMVGHRSKEYSKLQSEVTPKLQKLLYTNQRVYLFASSSSGVMEGAVRQASTKRMLNTVCGAFSKRWHQMTQANGVPCDKLEVPMGQAVTPELVDEALSKGDYDAITLTHNETSTGIMNPVQATAAMIHEKYPDVLILVDAVSSMAGVKIEVDAWGLDVCLAGTQKCFAVPPGLTVCAVSDRARERALQVPNRGHYFAWDQMDKKYEASQTPATPAISLIQALDQQMDDILAEGLDERFARHTEMAEIVREWARSNFGLYGDERYLSNTVTNVENTRGISVASLNEELGKRGAMISNGYGDLKEKCFRIGHMGDHQVADIRWLLDQINDILGL
ncbi:MAG: alanine--glyoxylate aminotransferase family protein [Anaerolineae bacterium]|jgi:aspartate aminotransferase-like enzyme|nr:alanine--glyoxylate aminotransferase family protein [Anaerolineae bacterium]MDX9829255.1 alanine--glyoxylate aminotransferase family protein [Anaerolineae bacterium]